MRKYYYHLTKPENVSSILNNGLLANENGEIYLYEAGTYRDIRLSDDALKRYQENGIKPTNSDLIIEEKPVSHHIARNQVFIKEYAVFSVSRYGIKVELQPDNVVELTAKFQWICKQPKIESKYLRFCGIYSE